MGSALIAAGKDIRPSAARLHLIVRFVQEGICLLDIEQEEMVAFLTIVR